MAARSNTVFIGAKGTVAAIDRDTGVTRWASDLKGSDFVNVVFQNGDLYAASKGRLYRLDPDSGAILWCNELPGLGWGIVTIASASTLVPSAAEQIRREAQAAASAATS